MILVLEVARYRGSVPAVPLSARFDEGGGSIGRSELNHLVLPDAGQIVSRNHANISFSNGHFMYVDNSQNGTRVCGENRTLFKGDSLSLNDGVCLELGEYQLQVHIQAEDKTFFQEPSAGPFDHVHPSTGFNQSASAFDWPISAHEHQALPENRFYEDPFFDDKPADDLVSDWPSCKKIQNINKNNLFINIFDENNIVNNLGEDLVIYSGSCKNSQNKNIIEAEKNDLSDEFFDFYPVKDGLNEKKFDDKLSSFQADLGEDARTDLPASSLEAQAKQPAAAQPAQDASADLFQCFLEGAGLETPSHISLEDQMEAMKELGLVLRHMIDGLMAMLRARHEEKSEIRTNVTVLSGKNNNPLKFIPSVEAAINVMLYKKYRKGYLDPVIAVQEGLSDIRNHEMAMRVAIQASLADILKQFDPEPFEVSLEKGGVFQSKKSKCWEAYCQAYPGLVNEAMDGLFKGVFVDAYESQVQRLNESYGKQ